MHFRITVVTQSTDGKVITAAVKQVECGYKAPEAIEEEVVAVIKGFNLFDVNSIHIEYHAK